MSTWLYRLGGWTADHPWRTIVGWLAALAVAVGLSMAVGGSTHDDYRVAGSPAQAGADFLAEHFDGSLDSSARESWCTRHDGMPSTRVTDRRACPIGSMALPHVTVGRAATALRGRRHRTARPCTTGYP